MTASRVLLNLEMLPGELWGRVILHQVQTWEGPLACWTYSTGGLAGRHPELVFTVAVDDNDKEDVIPTAPLQLFATVYQQRIAQGHRMRAGDVIELREHRLFDHHILLVDAQILEEVELPLDSLVFHLITSDELRAVREYGAGRVLARLGQAAGYFPYPSWSDRRRRALSLRETFQASALGKIPRVASWLFRVTGAGDQIELVIQRSAAPMLQGVKQVGDHVPFALSTMIDPRADACLVWEPGQQRPAAIARPGSRGDRIAGCFVAFLPGQAADGGRLLEDGYAVALTPASWLAVRGALLTGKDLTVPATDGNKSFRLTWAADPHVLPMIGAPYSDEAGWATGLPDDIAAPAAPMQSGPRVALGATRLVTPEDDFGSRSSPRELTMFIRDLQLAVERGLVDHTGAFEAVVHVRCTPAGYTAELRHRGDASAELLARLHEAIRGQAKLPVRDGDVVFEIDLSLSR